MYEIVGKYTKAIITIDELDDTAISQIYEFINHPLFTNLIVIMPDSHAGKGAVIGFTMELTNGIIPNVIGVDINCGMYSVNVGKNLYEKLNKKEIDTIIKDNIPMGEGKSHKKPDKNYIEEAITELICNTNLMNFKLQSTMNAKFGKLYEIHKFDERSFKEICSKIGAKSDYIYASIGTLGGGNHFIEISKDSNNDYWITIHSGSRNFGARICEMHQKIARSKFNSKEQQNIKSEFDEIKKHTKNKQKLSKIHDLLKKKIDPQEHIPTGLHWLEDQDMFNYLLDMIVASNYASVNRKTIANIILDKLELTKIDSIETVHNYLNYDDFIIRKGAISAKLNERLIIPLNNEDGILLCEGLGNSEWNYSAPHGAGRIGPRSQFKEKKYSQEALERMKKLDIYSSYIPTDETKLSYKDSNIIKTAIDGVTVKIIDILKPTQNIKG